jgi:hypothetical protein
VCTQNMSGCGNMAMDSRFRENDRLSCAHHLLTTFACTQSTVMIPSPKDNRQQPIKALSD